MHFRNGANVRGCDRIVRLSDRELMDIGTTRGEIDYVTSNRSIDPTGFLGTKVNWELVALRKLMSRNPDIANYRLNFPSRTSSQRRRRPFS